MEQNGALAISITCILSFVLCEFVVDDEIDSRVSFLQMARRSLTWILANHSLIAAALVVGCVFVSRPLTVAAQSTVPNVLSIAALVFGDANVTGLTILPANWTSSDPLNSNQSQSLNCRHFRSRRL